MRKLLLAFYSFILTGAAMAQTNGSVFNLPTVIPNAPQAASLGRYGDIPVAVNTGVPSISVPLYTIKSGKLSVPVSFNYHGSGIKVMDKASSVGLGWALSAGGDISRVVQGLEDEDSYGGFSHIRMPDRNDPSLEAKEKCLASNICNTFDGQQPWDGQPDLYFYSFGNRSGQFIPKNWQSYSLHPGFMTMPFAPIQIDYGNGNGGMPPFIITDVDGTQYTFAAYDSSNVRSNVSTRVHNAATAWHLQKILSADRTDSIVFKYNYVSLFWYVTNIPRILNRNYDPFGAPAGYSYTVPTSNTTDITEYLVTEIDFNNGKMTFDYSQGGTSSGSTQMNAVHLYNGSPDAYTEIRRWDLFHSDFVSRGVSSGFDYVLRLDSVQETGYYGNSTVSQPPYTFSYYAYSDYQCPPFNTYAQDFWGYFNGQTANQDLTFVAIPSISSIDPPYSAAYKREPDPDYMKVGTLHSMRYPTGGNTVFDFEPNQTTRTYMRSDTSFSYLSGAYVTSFNQTAANNTMTTVTFTLTQNLLVQPAYGDKNAKLDFTGSRVCTSGCVANDPIVKLDDLTAGGTIANIELTQLNNANPPSLVERIVYLNLVTGHTYKLYFPNPGALTGSQGWTNLINRLDATLSGQAVGSINTHPVTETVLTGGLRIRQVTSLDGAGKTLVKEYKYPGVYFNSSLFHGDFDDVALNNFTFDAYNLMATKDGRGCGLFGRQITRYASNLTLPLGAATNNSVSYNEVEEYESDGKGHYNGKTVYDYKIASDIVDNGMPFYKVSKESDRGLLLQKRIYKYVNGGYALVQNLVNNYTDLDSTYTNTDTVVFYAAHALVDNYVTKQGSPGNPVTGDAVTGTSGLAFACLGCTHFDMQTKYLVTRFYYTSPRSVIKSAVVTEYDDKGHSMITRTLYDYQNPVHAWPTHQQKTASTGKTIDQYSKYVPDYPAAASCTNSCMADLAAQLNALKAAYFPLFGNEDTRFHINQTLTGGYSVPICVPNTPDSVIYYENVYQQDLDNYQQAVDSLCNIYNSCIAGYNTCVANYYNTASDDAKGLIDLQTQHNIGPELEKTVYRDNSLVSTTQTYFKTFGPGNTQQSRVMASMGNNVPESRLEYLDYDAYGKLKVMRKSNDMPLSYIWDYHNEFPVAEVKNADIASVAYTSFEADGKGYWDYTTSARTPVTGITGARSYNLQDGAISRQGLTPGKAYIISYWSQNGSYYISGGTATTRTGKTVNGWTYYEHVVTAGSSILTVSGGGWIDELRCYPSQAQMTTYTYDPLIGMTSSSDAQGRVTYYEYDGLGRLVTVKDQDGNIIKTLEYHFQDQ